MPGTDHISKELCGFITLGCTPSAFQTPVDEGVIGQWSVDPKSRPSYRISRIFSSILLRAEYIDQISAYSGVALIPMSPDGQHRDEPSDIDNNLYRKTSIGDFICVGSVQTWKFDRHNVSTVDKCSR